MCGIVAVLEFDPKWGVSYSARKVFTQLLISDSVRGTDGTGVFIVPNDGPSRTLKIGSHPFALLGSKEWPEFFEIKQPKGNYDPNLPKDQFLIGHNRWKTTGDATTAHAHPHVVGDILLVHNGTIQTYSDLPRLKNFEVDSQALANSLHELGPEETIAKMYGGCAMIYWDKKEQTINVYRNDKRPLAIATDFTGKRIYIASEKDMLEWILRRKDNYVGSDTVIEIFPTDTLYTWNKEEIKPISKRKIEGPKTQKYYAGYATISQETEVDLVDFMNGMSRMKEEKAKKKLNGKLGYLRKAGIEMVIIQVLNGMKKGDKLDFRVTDYADENPADETFIVMGESAKLPLTSIRFRIKGEKQLSALFECPTIKATISNLIHYPEGNEQKDKYVIWVKDADILLEKETESAIEIPSFTNGNVPSGKVDPYGRAILLPKEIH